jgi:16S rRNA processing protein RimM
MVIFGERERLIPFLLDRFVDAVDFDTGEIRVDWDADF